MVYHNESIMWQTGQKVISRLKSDGHKAYFVGGCVRDSILKREIKDIDIATSARPEDVMKIFKKTVPTGIEHGTVLVLYKEIPFEVTTFRTETSYSDRRHPDSVQFIRDLEGDLKRRDFTINAMAMNENYQLIDLFKGKRDLVNKRIKTVGNASHRFEEDALRMLRALRFASQLGFKIAPETYYAIQDLSASIKYVAIERIKIEIEKLLNGEAILNTIQQVVQSQLMQYFPIFKNKQDLIGNILKIKSPLENFSVFIALMYLENQEVSIQSWGRAWNCSNQEIKTAQSIKDAFLLFENDGLTPWLVYQTLSFEYTFKNFLKVKGYDTNQLETYYDQLKIKLPIKTNEELSINGHDVMKIFPHLKRGKWIRVILNKVEKEVVMGNLSNQNEKIKEWIECHPPVKD